MSKKLMLKDQSTTLDIENYNGVIKIDLREMMGLNNESEEAFIKVDEISKMFGKRVEDYFRFDKHKELFDALERNKVQTRNRVATFKDEIQVDSPFKPLEWEKEKSNYWFEDVRYNRQWHKSKLAYRLDGRAKSMLTDIKGTYVHSSIVLSFMRWLSVDLEVQLDMKFKELVKNMHLLKRNRKATISEFHKLVAVTEKYYPPKQQEGYAGEYADAKLMDLINIMVVGSVSSKFREVNNVKHDEPTRKYFTSSQLEKVELCETIVCGLIEYGGLNNYRDIKNALKEKLEG